MTQNENGNEPFKLAEKLRSEIVEVEPIEEKIQAGTIVRPEDEERFRETEGTTKLPPKRKTRKSQARFERISKFRSELRRHSNARRRTDLAIQGIQRQLKDLLPVHHTTIRDLQKQVTQLQRKMVTLDGSKKSSTSKKTGSMRKGKRGNNPKVKKSKLRKSKGAKK
jgi:hypothetical protein